MKCGTPEEQKILTWVAQLARTTIGAKKIILFGSRARGDADDRSDFDIAVDAAQPGNISELRATLEENPYTKCRWSGFSSTSGRFFGKKAKIAQTKTHLLGTASQTDIQNRCPQVR